MEAPLSERTRAGYRTRGHDLPRQFWLLFWGMLLSTIGAAHRCDTRCAAIRRKVWASGLLVTTVPAGIGWPPGQK